MRYGICVLASIALTAVVSVDSSLAKDTSASKVDHAKVRAAINKAADFLKHAQANDGSFSACQYHCSDNARGGKLCTASALNETSTTQTSGRA